MSFTPDGVKIDNASRRNRAIISFLLKIAEIALSVILIITLASHAVFPEQARGAMGVSKVLSYQGRLTDTSGNPLGGSGTNYCFRFSIYDALSAGNQVWPGGTPSSNTVSVQSGVFNVGIGELDDLSLLNFYGTSTLYLNVEVNATPTTCAGSWETLSPRQRMDATAYARVAEDIYGPLLKTRGDLTPKRVQVGTGVAGNPPIYLSLDWGNATDQIGGSCPSSVPNGTIWYNSNQTRALVCENNLIKALSNATTTLDALAISGNTAGTPVTITGGTITLAGGNNITLSQVGNIITISGAAGGGGGAQTLSSYIPNYPASTASQTMGAMGASTGSAIYYPFILSSPVSFNALRIPIYFSYATSSVSGRQTISSLFGIYSNNANTLSLISSNSFSLAITNSSVSATLSYPASTNTAGYTYTTVSASTTAQIHSLFGTVGTRVVDLQFGGAMSLNTGIYWFGGLQRRSSSSANVGISAGLVGNVVTPMQNIARIGSASSALTTAFSIRQPLFAFGPYTSTGSAGYGGTALPTSVFVSGIAHTATIMPLITLASTT